MLLLYFPCLLTFSFLFVLGKHYYHQHVNVKQIMTQCSRTNSKLCYATTTKKTNFFLNHHTWNGPQYTTKVLVDLLLERRRKGKAIKVVDSFHIHNTHFGGSRVLREQKNFLKWQSFLTNLKNTFIFGKNQHIIIWITHPTRSLGALSKRDCSYLIRFCPYRRERKIFFFLVALRRRLSESTFVITVCVTVMVVRTDNKQSWHCNLLGLKQYISWFAASALVKHTGICFLNIVCIYFFGKVSYVLQFLRDYVVLTRMNLIVLNNNYIIGKVSRYICIQLVICWYLW